MTDLLTRLADALEEERRVRLLGQEPDVHWESMREIRRAAYAAIDAALAAFKAQPSGDEWVMPEPAFRCGSSSRDGTTPLFTADQLRSAYEAGLAARIPAGWQEIETAPKDQVFLGWVRAERWSAADGEGSGRAHDVSQGDFCWWRAVVGSPDGGYFDNGAGQIGDRQAVTHWMKLPGPPITATEAPAKGGE